MLRRSCLAGKRRGLCDLGRRSLPDPEAEYEYAARAGRVGADYARGDGLTPGGQHRANTWHGVFAFVVYGAR
ncbi:MAG: hypothetical protein MRY64_01945 [Hyphomonadaceae bacterium]|nr:hypothetical protein [Hyphomonadaceae bacterium]